MHEAAAAGGDHGITVAALAQTFVARRMTAFPSLLRKV
jgi:hypothetical protein